MASCSKNAISSAFSFHNTDNNLVEMVEPCLLFVEISTPEPGSNDFVPDSVFCEVTDSTGISKEFDFEGDDRWKLATYDVESGSTTLFAPGITLDLKKRIIRVPEDAVPEFGAGFSLFHDDDDDEESPYSGRYAKNANGTFEVLIVAVVGTGPEDRHKKTYAEISDNFFGTHGHILNTANQMSACSYGRLNYIPTKNPNVTDGVIEINIGHKLKNYDGNGADYDYLEARKEAQEIMKEYIGELPGPHRHIIYVFPRATDGWNGAAGNANLGGYRVQFREPNYLYLGLMMHELGHNLNMRHSYEDGKEYGDGSGFMGGAICAPNRRTTQQCFNGRKSWLVDWYIDRQVSVHPLEDPLWQEDLAGVADYKKDETLVTLRILGNTTNDFFVSYNRKAGIVQDACENGDEVVVHTSNVSIKNGALYSDKVAFLKEGERYVVNDWDLHRPLNIIFDSLDNSTDVWKPNVIVYATCYSDTDCDNGEPCDGDETCGDDGGCLAGTPIYCAEPSAAPTQFCLDSSLLSLQQDGGIIQNANVSNVFDIDAMTDMYLRSMELKVKNTESHIVTVYAKEGSYVGNDGDESAWITIADEVSLEVGVKTVDLSPYFVNGGTTHSIYVHVAALEDGGLIMRQPGQESEDTFLDVAEFDDNLSMKWGLKIKGSPFSDDQKVAKVPYMMRGTIYYNVCGEKPSTSPSISMIPSKSMLPTESKRPSTKPSISFHPSESFLPSMSPSHFCQVNPLLSLILDSGSGKAISAPVSIVFDIDALKSIYIETLFLKIKEGAEHVVKVYTKQGSYDGYEKDASAWTPIVDGVTMTQGLIPYDSFLSFFVDEGSTQAFFVYVASSNGGKLSLENGGTDVDFGGVSTANDDISLKYGKRIKDSFGGKESKTPHILKGEIHYRTCEDAVTSVPTKASVNSDVPTVVQNTPVPSLFPTTAAPTTAAPTTAAPTTAVPTTPAPITAAPTPPVPITSAPTKGKSKKQLIKECKKKVAAFFKKQIGVLKKAKKKGMAVCKQKPANEKKQCMKDEKTKFRKASNTKKKEKNFDTKQCNKISE
eukprot:CAMPEP_0194315380 /NCGR_PEP_ID=MMETSP0171-20130528/12189_1 /TAXON_ID=218684 /ORGANISM="Corethron pennatum, Strain L29A3" /LENGTH=1050 /DNA_ID=CAMNT_0039071179 /DNA_START=170 /DNA_END=3322 /DNA_ORIENTATION=+